MLCPHARRDVDLGRRRRGSGLGGREGRRTERIELLDGGLERSDAGDGLAAQGPRRDGRRGVALARLPPANRPRVLAADAREVGRVAVA